tara:strand:+ start:1705 stop:2754 length:1050 start_codon:yes stop_codon:yes gene_type:complete
MNYKFWNNKKVLLTGNTGFKGSWMSMVLLQLGAKLYGFSERDNTNDIFFKTLGLNTKHRTFYGDISNYKKFNKIYNKIKPDIVIHMAAQPYVKKSYKIPLKTINDNVMGTVNVLEAIRNNQSPKMTLIITSDKCYQNNEIKNYFKEGDSLGGSDIYSASKSMAEIVCKSYYDSFEDLGNIITLRAGNIFGGGDFGENRLLPDYFKSIFNKKKFIIRSPYSVRPWQYILRPISSYIKIVEKTYSKSKYFDTFNIGPDKKFHLKVIELIKKLDQINNIKKSYIIKKSNFKESKILQLDNKKFEKFLPCKKEYSMEECLNYTNKWYFLFKEKNKKELYEFTNNHIKNYFSNI